MDKNDNLPSQADGAENTAKEEITTSPNDAQSKSDVRAESTPPQQTTGKGNEDSATIEDAIIAESNKETNKENDTTLTEAVESSADSDEDVIEEKDTTQTEAVESNANSGEDLNEDAEINNDVAIIAKENDNENANEKEKSIPEVDYTELSLSQLTVALRELMQEHPLNKIKNQADDIKKVFEKALAIEETAAREKHTAEEAAKDEDQEKIEFSYKNEHADEFFQLHSLYRKQKGELQRAIRKEQEDNLAKKRTIIDGIKNLITEEENIGTTFKKFNDLQALWRETGKIPHDAYNVIWEDYRLHTQNFYDYIDLSKELRDKDFERNLEFRKKIIERAVELGEEKNIHKALRELQELHRMWKEDTGPVSKEQRDPIWDEFKAATTVIHDKRQAYYDERDKQAAINQTIKQNIIAEIEKITATPATSHKGWQDKLEEVKTLKELFSQTGGAPKAVNNKLWDSYRTVNKAFNNAKNAFYKDIKKEQNDNLDKKKALVAIALEHQESDNFQESLEVMKRIQREWKDIGHVPRKDSDKIWKKFKTACDAFFNRKNEQRKEDNAEETANYNAKLEVYSELKEMVPQDDEQAMKTALENLMKKWNDIGRVPYAKRHIQDKYEKLLLAKLKATGMNEVDAEMIKYENKLESLKSGDDRDFKNERFYLSKRREEIQKEITQLENNLAFINTKDDKNPFLVQTQKNIAALKKEMSVIKEKGKQLNILQRQLEKENAVEEPVEETTESDNA